ncbi:hypothetical protein O3M35_011302 [Rhynocoris fuscipes]|uniref:Uncharacterized protein n=1 Tax=Rhynocoris fuscipes TaxID=488301 RepID=A0AAW1CX13_9HEMI
MSPSRLVLRKANECKIFLCALRQFHSTSMIFINLRETCDSGKCIKRNKIIEQFLQRKEGNYLQPKKKQICPSSFKEQKPLVPPFINMTLEKNCRIIAECKRTQKGEK